MRGELSVFDKYCYLQKGQSRTEDRFRPDGLRAMQQEGGPSLRALPTGSEKRAVRQH